MKKIIYTIICLLLITFMCGCEDENNYEGQVKVTFHLEGGTYMNCTRPVVLYFDYSDDEANYICSPIDLTRKEITKSGYNLVGWYKTKIEDGEEVSYSDEFNFETDTVGKEGLNLYAYWEKKIVYAYNGNVFVSTGDGNCTFNGVSGTYTKDGMNVTYTISGNASTILLNTNGTYSEKSIFAGLTFTGSYYGEWDEYYNSLRVVFDDSTTISGVIYSGSGTSYYFNFTGELVGTTLTLTITSAVDRGLVGKTVVFEINGSTMTVSADSTINSNVYTFKNNGSVSCDGFSL